MDHTLGRSPYSVDFYLEKRFPAWRRFAEWAPTHVLEQEPRRLPWNIQVVIIVGILVMLAVFLAIIGSELNAAAQAPQTSIPTIIHVVSLYHTPLLDDINPNLINHAGRIAG